MSAVAYLMQLAIVYKDMAEWHKFEVKEKYIMTNSKDNFAAIPLGGGDDDDDVNELAQLKSGKGSDIPIK